MEREKIVKRYSNGEVTVIWKPDLCIHSTICFRELPDVFKPYHRPWIDPNGASTQQIIDTVSRCPTQALTYEWDQKSEAETQLKSEPEIIVEKPAEEKKPAAEITLLDSGPFLIKGDFIVRDQNGNVIPTASVITLCRCGTTKNKPFCDGSHNFIKPQQS
jgi:uncharacterized Fe-S cluster protein YjdI